MFSDSNYNGQKDRYTSDAAQVKRNNDASSFKLKSGCCLEIFDTANFHGKSKEFCNSIGWLGSYGWNDKLSSFKLYQGNFSSDNRVTNSLAGGVPSAFPFYPFLRLEPL